MVLNDCTICSVYGPDNTTLQSRVRVKCTGEQITLHFKKVMKLPNPSGCV